MLAYACSLCLISVVILAGISIGGVLAQNYRLSTRFTARCLAVQQSLANRVALGLRVPKVYVYDSVGYFSNATQASVDGIRYLMTDDSIAVLSTTAQQVFQSANQYLQLNIEKPYILETDAVGVFALFDGVSRKSE